MKVKKKIRYEIENGFDLMFPPLEDSVKIKKTKKGYEVKYLTHDDNPISPDEYGDNDLFIVHYHRNCWITRDNIITEGDARNWYRRDFADYQDEGEEMPTELPIEKDFWLFPVSAYIHSGVYLSLANSFPYDPQGWDTSHVGIALVSKREWNTKEKAFEAAKNKIEEWNQYLSGDVWCVVTEYFNKKKNQTDYDVYGGCYGEEYAMQELTA